MRIHRERGAYFTIPFVLAALSLSIVFSALAPGARADDGSLVGRVVGVKDGDSLVVLSDNREIEVRVAEVDAPESGQPYGRRAKQALSALVFGKDVRLVPTDHDRYGRTVGRVFVDDVDVANELVRRGAVWVYRQYAHRSELYALEAEAQETRVGLWGLPEAERTPPWDWRHAHRHAGSSLGVPPAAADRPPPLRLVPGGQDSGASRLAPGAAAFGCGDKRYCKEMSSCEEARFYLTRCGGSHLDGDGDGRPCEALCGK
jgi:endonuclease YncB( thermonuclease family)